MHFALGLVILVAVATAIAAGARRLNLSEPLLLTVAGVAGSYLPFVPDVNLTPDLVLTGLIPPLLYSAAIRTSLVDFKRYRRAIGLLSVGLVLATAFAVGTVAWLILPIPYSTAIALGAIVAPPDAVAAIAVARRVGIPRQIETILEGESLLNDATALVTLRTAIAATAGSVSIAHVVGQFLLASVGGVVIGVAVAMIIGQLRRRVTDPVIDTTLSFLAPFAAYLPAEELHSSGVLAVVVAGLILGHRAPVWQTAASRIAERTNWRTIDFLLENSVFLLIGLQVRLIVQAAWRSGLNHPQLIGACVAVLAAVVLIRPVWVFPATYVPRWIPAIGRNDPPPPWRTPALISWAGMRGVVTLAAAFVLPKDTPYRDVLVLLALVVVGGTLLAQGTSLPVIVRRLGLRGPSAAEDALQIAGLVERATTAGTDELDRVLEQIPERKVPADVINQLRERAAQRSQSQWERLGPSEADRTTPSELYRLLRLKMLRAERAEVLAVRNSGVLDQEILTVVLGMLDLEESMIDRVDEAQEDLAKEELVPLRGDAACDHLKAAATTQKPDTPGRCQSCIDEGLVWVHLRMCLTCGHVACCDSSVGLHADKHFRDSGHPVMRSVEPGEAWRWCYVDARLG